VGDDWAAFLRELGERLRLARARRGMTRRLLASQSGVSERYIAQMEAGSGNVSVLLLRAICGALGVPAAELLADPPDAGPERAPLDPLLARLSAAQLAEARTLLIGRFGTGPSARRRRIALIGLRGAGKSTLGRLLAEQREVPFFELDGEVEREAGLAVGAIIELHGQAAFRRLERRALERLVAHPEAVIAAGGGIVAEPGTFDLLLGHCRTVWIRTSPEEHMRRVIDQGDLRPMRDGDRQAMRDLRTILASREALYARADLVLDTSGKPVGESYMQLLDLIRLDSPTLGTDDPAG
jgi:XRE family transcriptional regulator, aerobic/anaerobic benzoate catabolism transcriptional regulator